MKKKLIMNNKIKKEVLKNIQFDSNLRNSFGWFLKSINLMSASTKIRDDHKEEACLLAGYAFELLFKSYIISENKFTGKSLPKILNSHDLIFLKSKISAKLKTSKFDNKILNALSEYVVWKGRYPIPLKVKDLKSIVDVDFDEVDIVWKKILKKMPTELSDEIELLRNFIDKI